MASKLWTTKPPLGTQINWSHPSTQGLVHAAIFNEGGGPPRDLVTGDVSTQTGTGQSWGGFQGGLSRSYDGSGGRDKFPSRTANQITGPITVMCGFVSDVATSDTNWHELLNKRVSVAGGINIEFGFNFNNNSSGTSYRQWFWANGTYQVINTTGTAVPQNTFQIWTGTRSSATAGSLYVNGVNVATGSALGAAIASTTAITYGAIEDGVEPFQGKYSFGYIWNRELSAAEIQLFSQNPYLFIQTPRRRLFAPSGAPTGEFSTLSLATDPNLVFYNKLESVTSTTGTNLTNNGSTPFNPAMFGNGADGGTSNTTKYLSSTTSPLTYAQAAAAWSINTWFKPNATWTGTNQYLGDIKASNGTNIYDLQLFYHLTTNTIRPYLNNGAGNTFVDSTINPTSGTWYMLTLTFNGTNAKIYINAVLKNTVAWTPGSGAAGSTTGIAVIGSVGGGAFGDVIMDDFVVLTRELTAAEVSYIYTGTNPTTAAFRKTLSPVGTRIGSRQMQYH